MSRQHRTKDTLLELKDAGLLAASAACQVGGNDQILDLGDGNWMGDLMIDVTALEVATGDELYIIGLQLSGQSDFASDIVEAVSVHMGDATKLAGDIDSPLGRYTVPMNNDFAGTVRRYARLYVTISGTIATGINFTAYAAKRG